MFSWDPLNLHEPNFRVLVNYRGDLGSALCWSSLLTSLLVARFSHVRLTSLAQYTVGSRGSQSSFSLDQFQVLSWLGPDQNHT